MKPRYHQVVLGHNTDPPKGVRLRGGELKLPYNLENRILPFFYVS